MKRNEVDACLGWLDSIRRSVIGMRGRATKNTRLFPMVEYWQGYRAALKRVESKLNMVKTTILFCNKCQKKARNR